MADWTQASDFRNQIQRWWDRGDLLMEAVNDQSTFPRKLKLKAPGSAEMSSHFEDVRNWISELSKISEIRITTKEINHRIIGKNAFPDAAYVDSLDIALKFIGKQKAAVKFCEMWKQTQAVDANLLNWLTKRPHQALELHDQWPQMLAVISWMKINHRPGIYLRQVDLPNVHSKFIENHRGVLLELLDLALPPQAFDAGVSGVRLFAQRYGFKEKPILIRFRILDSQHTVLGGIDEDITLNLEALARIQVGVTRVIIVENEINFLALPPMSDTMAIFGAGYGMHFLSKIEWLQDKTTFYWGDIDTHGYAILNSARLQLPHLSSILMDQSTFLRHRSSWGFEKDQHSADFLGALTAEEQEMYSALKEQKWGKNLRLEQEHIEWSYAEHILLAAR